MTKRDPRLADEAEVLSSHVFIGRAAGFAAVRHQGQIRKYTGEPYFVHLVEVAELLRYAGMSHYAVAAGYLHDVLEDTDTTYGELKELFGEWTANLVWGVTDQSKPEDGNRAARKAIDREHLAVGLPGVHSIKLADLISNTRTIVDHDPNFAKVYLEEKALLLPVLRGGSPVLHAQAERSLADAMEKISA